VTGTTVAVPVFGDMVILPLQVPRARPVGFTVAVKVAGVLPVMGDTDNQLAPLPTAAPKNTSPTWLFELVRAMLWDTVDVSPTVALNVRFPGEITSEGFITTVSVTGTFKGLFVACFDVSVTVPL
jgi:hypothetical protein